MVEVGSGLVIPWQFRHKLPETRERQALRCIGISFFALAAYVSVGVDASTAGSQRGRTPTLGIWIAALLGGHALPVPAQRRTGLELGSGSVVADSKQTLLCTYLSAVLLAGLLVNSLSVVGRPDRWLVIAGVATREGLKRGAAETCGCGPTIASSSNATCCTDAHCSGVKAAS